jgi:hypothetical protein
MEIMKAMSKLRELVGVPRMLANINEGIKNETSLLNDKLIEMKSAVFEASNHVGVMLTNINDGIKNETSLLNDKLVEIKSSFDSVNNRAGIFPNAEASYGKALNVNYLPALPFPKVDMTVADPINEIVKRFEFHQCAQVLYRQYDDRISLISAHSQALLYCIIRNIRPALVVEIGSYKAGTSKVICWALAANGYGRLHTIDPFGGNVVPGIIASWPPYLRDFVDFYPINSMEYFANLTQTGGRSDLTLVDGEHDYEFAVFDIEAAARVAAPNGFIFVDNTSQAGPFLAAQDFAERHTDWIECGGNSLRMPIVETPFEVRSLIADTDFCVLRGPAAWMVTSRPSTLGQLRWPRSSLQAIRLVIDDGPPGVLHAQCVVRTFGNASSLGEYPIKNVVNVDGTGEISIKLDFQLSAEASESVVFLTAEPWLIWRGQRPLSIRDWLLT